LRGTGYCCSLLCLTTPRSLHTSLSFFLSSNPVSPFPALASRQNPVTRSNLAALFTFPQLSLARFVSGALLYCTSIGAHGHHFPVCAYSFPFHFLTPYVSYPMFGTPFCLLRHRPVCLYNRPLDMESLFQNCETSADYPSPLYALPDAKNLLFALPTTQSKFQSPFFFTILPHALLSLSMRELDIKFSFRAPKDCPVVF